ncbi:MAG: IS200/IS605 family transposase [Cyclobacteriaceae bacterium]|nr:IS200/IS605 family transposase [Cyclobacteriaceae bacterium]UYN86796.1 MAG: IS200/IS605 family transposase [Cyclobacteriaceae bacterium]
MPNTYTQLYIQIVFAVKGRLNLIHEKNREELEKYTAGIISNLNQKLYAIYCMPDHVHILVSIKPDVRISDLVRDIKANSSRFINEKKWIAGKFQWQEGYGVFSYSHAQLKNVVNYILNQPAHHHVKSFREEYIELLEEFNIAYKPEYLFEFSEH